MALIVEYAIAILFLVTESCLTLCNPMDCSLTGSSSHGVLQARILEWVTIPFSREFHNPGLEPGFPALQGDSLHSKSLEQLRWRTQFSSVIHDWLFAIPWTQHSRLPCPSPAPGAYSNSCPKSRCYHPTISFYVIPSSSYLQFFPASGYFQITVLHSRRPKYWSFSFSISPSNKCSGLISFRMDWLDLLAVQGTLNSRLQHHSSKASILRFSAFFIVQLSHPYMTPGKTIALTWWTFVGKVMSMLFKGCLGWS